MKRPAFLFRPNMRRKDHQTAWEILNSQAVGNKADFIVAAIMQAENKPVTEEILRKVIQDELANQLGEIEATSPPKSNEFSSNSNLASEVPAIMLDFLSGLDL